MGRPKRKRTWKQGTIFTPGILEPLNDGGFGFTDARIIEIYETSDDVAQIIYAQAVIDICARTTDEYTELIGVAKALTGSGVVFAFHVFPDMFDASIDDLALQDVLEELAEKFGSVITIGGISKKYFIEEYVSAVSGESPPASLRDWIRGEPPGVRVPFWVYVAGGDHEFLKIALAFCIDQWAYRGWIEGWQQANP